MKKREIKIRLVKMKKIGKSGAENVFTKGVIGTQNMKSDSSMK